MILKERDAAGAVFAFDVNDQLEYELLTFGPTTDAEMADPARWSLPLALAVSARDRQPFLMRPTLRDDRMPAQEDLFRRVRRQERPYSQADSTACS